MRPITEAPVADPGLAVVEIAASDDDTALAVQDRLAVVTQVRVVLPWGVPPGGLDGLPPFVGEPSAAAGAHRTAGLPLGRLLFGHAARLLLVLPLAGCVLGLLAGVMGYATGVADRLQERLVVRSAEAPEDRPGRAVLLQLVHAGDHNGELAVVHVKAVAGGAPASAAGSARPSAR
ncbi:DUF6207 family protein [Streptomyces hawaiiensis]|uniref:DUF6207 family protein n=1 Tax=Streptomyces hawaiiensis TaxID=67305 RepID=UPI0036513758